MEKENPSYYAIIPANVRYDDKLTANAKLLYGEITALCNKYGYCWATNKYFAELYKVCSQTISLWIKSLEVRGHIKSEVNAKNGNTRKIYLIPLRENQMTSIKKPEEVYKKILIPLRENPTYNNTINNTDNNTINSSSYEEEAKPSEDKKTDSVSLIRKEKEKKVKSPAKKERKDNRNPEIEAVMALYKEEFGISPPAIRGGNGFDLNRGSALRMIKQFGFEELKKMILLVFKYQKTEKFIKRCTNPIEFERNFASYKLFFNQLKQSLLKQQTEKQNSPICSVCGKTTSNFIIQSGKNVCLNCM